MEFDDRANFKIEDIKKDIATKVEFYQYDAETDEHQKYSDVDGKTVQDTEYEIYIFANFDICNFTKYKREHKNWTNLLEKYLDCIKVPGPDWAISRFWKFNGDSLTFRRKIKSIFEICEFIECVQIHLDHLQDYLNDELSEKRVYIKAATWIAGFDKESCQERFTNNLRISVANVDEFVGENIDEGFRLSTYSKAGKLVIDPKIVALLYLYDDCFSDVKEGNIANQNYKYSTVKYHSDYIRAIINETVISEENLYNDGIAPRFEEIINKYFDHDNINKLNNICNRFFLMEYGKCKGVWDDRDYPIFWYIPSFKNCEFIYDEIVGDKKLREHDLFKNLFSQESDDDLFEDEEFIKAFEKANRSFRKNLLAAVEQISVVGTIGELAKHLMVVPAGQSEEGIYDKANLYYMVLCLVKKDEKDLGTLIFKRTQERHHLKGVWDLIPIKHSKVLAAKYRIVDYLNRMLNKELQLKSAFHENEISVKFIEDELRESIVPYSMCNIYRNKEIHNGILCVAEINIKGLNENDFVSKLKNIITNRDRYCDVKLVKKEHLISEDNALIIKLDDIVIHSLSAERVQLDALNVAEDPKSNIFANEEQDLGIAYLSNSINDVLSHRDKKGVV